MHFLIAGLAAAIATRRVYDQQATCRAVRRVETNGSTLRLEGSVDGVQNVSERERHLTLMWIKLEDVGLGRGSRSIREHGDRYEHKAKLFLRGSHG